MKAAWWPLYGAALGGAGMALYVSAIQFLPQWLAALAVVLFWAAVSRVLREDILFGAPRGELSPLKIAVRVLISAIWVAAFLHEGIARNGVLRMMAAAIASHTLSRAGVVTMAWVSRPAAGGLELTAHLRSGAALIAALIGVFAALIYGVRIGAALVVSAYVILRTARGWFYQRRGGIDGDDVANTRLLVEGFTLLVAVFAHF
jgi:cobalamin synthase